MAVMEVYESLDLEMGGEFGLALGIFDGVHLGHQAVIEAARVAGGKLGVVTFDPHPARVLFPEKVAARVLTSLEHKRDLLAKMGVDFLVVLPFTKERAGQAARDFAEELFASGVRRISVGEDWRFGKGRAGGVEELREWGGEKGVEVCVAEAVDLEGGRISSTRIRKALGEGNFSLTEKLLGRLYSVTGMVVEGRKLGREIGFPTANVATEEEKLPLNGVHVVRIDWGEGGMPGVANVGRRPTVEDGGRRMLEVHVLAEGVPDLYGREVEVSFLKMIREERKFGSVEELKGQIGKDCEVAREVLQVEG